jgi:hypothetical protein
MLTRDRLLAENQPGIKDDLNSSAVLHEHLTYLLTWYFMSRPILVAGNVGPVILLPQPTNRLNSSAVLHKQTK